MQQIANWISILTNKLLSHDQIILWAKNILSSNMLDTEIVVQTPWSSVLRISTPEGPLYLKQTPPTLFIEVDILKKYRNLCKITDIPEVIAENKNLHCFLMKECGDATLRTLFDGHLKIDLLVQGFQVYNAMQWATVPHIAAFIQAGVPDWRLEQFPHLYEDLVSNVSFLKANGLEMTQIKTLQDAIVSLEALCQELSSYGIPECLNHSDFHENNMLFSSSTKKISIIDLGETAINHPFFSLAAFLKIPCSNYKISLDSPDYQMLHDTCFQGWVLLGEDLQKALELTEKLLPIYLIFAHMRLVNATCPIALGNIPRMNNRVKEAFLWFIKNLSITR
ncbi:phosphotransferase [Legionella bozemanae]|uniref:phosphotransferase n=1 Tax=Legionella bozemanae TaxID=447 RepID=UPI003EEFB0A2